MRLCVYMRVCMRACVCVALAHEYPTTHPGTCRIAPCATSLLHWNIFASASTRSCSRSGLVFARLPLYDATTSHFSTEMPSALAFASHFACVCVHGKIEAPAKHSQTYGQCWLMRHEMFRGWTGWRKNPNAFSKSLAVSQSAAIVLLMHCMSCQLVCMSRIGQL